MPDKSPSGWYAPESTKLLFEKIFFGISIVFGLFLLLLLAFGRSLNDITHYLALGGTALLSGLAGWGMRGRRHGFKAIRDDLLRNGERLSAEVVKVVEDVSTMVNDKHPWRIHARCEIEGRLYEFQSWSLWEDPTSSLDSRTIDVYVKLNDLACYYVDTRFLESETVDGKRNPPVGLAKVETRRRASHRKGKAAEVEYLPRSDAFWLSRHFTVPRLLFAVSLPLLVGGGAWLNYEITFLRDGELLEGRLNDIRPRRTSKGSTWYVISYKDPLGKTVRFKSQQSPAKWLAPGTADLLDWIFPQSPMEGDGVTLRADWRRGRVRVDKWIYWLPPIFLLIPGAMFFAVAWYTQGGGGMKPSRRLLSGK